MSNVMLFHSVLGPRPGVADAADRLRVAGHTVHTPDFFDGKTFDDYPAGFAWVESMGGIDELVSRTKAAAAGLPADLVYAGFSLGGVSAELLAATRPGAKGLILLHAAIPVEEFGVATWPADVPVQIHYATADPYREQAELAAFERSVRASVSHMSCSITQSPVICSPTGAWPPSMTSSPPNSFSLASSASSTVSTTVRADRAAAPRRCVSTLKQWFHTTLAATGETGRYERYRRALIAPGFAGVKETTVEYRSELDLGSLVGIVYSTMPTEAMPAPPQRATFAGRWRRRPASPRA